VVDLVQYRSSVPGIFMRHILEHNYEWARVLDNALASFTQRMALILFTPEREATQEIAFQHDVGVPDIAFRLADITDRFPPDVDVHGPEDFVRHPVWLRNNPPPGATSKRGRGHALIHRFLVSHATTPFSAQAFYEVNRKGRSLNNLTL
jgi:hypothetical protein